MRRILMKRGMKRHVSVIFPFSCKFVDYSIQKEIRLFKEIRLLKKIPKIFR